MTISGLLVLLASLSLPRWVVSFSQLRPIGVRSAARAAARATAASELTALPKAVVFGKSTRLIYPRPPTHTPTHLPPDPTHHPTHPPTHRPSQPTADLDGCLWAPDMYMLWGGGAPFSKQENGELLDTRGQRVRMLGAVPEVLLELKTDPKWADAVVCIASCTDEPSWAQECMRLFDIGPDLVIKDAMMVEEIHGGNKQTRTFQTTSTPHHPALLPPPPTATANHHHEHHHHEHHHRHHHHRHHHHRHHRRHHHHHQTCEILPSAPALRSRICSSSTTSVATAWMWLRSGLPSRMCHEVSLSPHGRRPSAYSPAQTVGSSRAISRGSRAVEQGGSAGR